MPDAPASGNKGSVRDVAKRFRKSLTDEEKREKSGIIMRNLTAMDVYKKSRRVMVYVSKSDEVDTHELIRLALGEGKEVVVPKVEKRTMSIIPCLIRDFGDLCTGEFSVLEPKEVNKAEKNRIDFFIIPGIAFDCSGNRVGYGRGYWDRFLADVEKRHIVGLAFEDQIVHEVDKNSHDVPVSAIVTEKRVIMC